MKVAVVFNEVETKKTNIIEKEKNFNFEPYFEVEEINPLEEYEKIILSLKKSGYKNIVSAEVFTHGFYEAEELLNNFLEFPQTKNILFSTQYQEIGLSAVIADVDNCPMQVVVAHLGGYVPPNYSKEEKESWASLIKSLEDVIPSYETARSATGIDQDILEKVINLLTTRLSNAKRIYARIQKNEWLTEEEEIIAADDKRLSQETESLISKLIKR